MSSILIIVLLLCLVRTFCFCQEQLPPPPRPSSLFVKHHANRQHAKKQVFFNDSTLDADFRLMLAITLDVNYTDPYWKQSCDPKSSQGGQTFPPPVCSPQNPCTNVNMALRVFTKRVYKITAPQFTEEHGNECKGTVCEGICAQQYTDVMQLVSEKKLKQRGRHVHVDDGPLQKIKIENTMIPEASLRRYCSFVPKRNETVKAQQKPPLVVYISASGDNATGSLYSRTMNIRALAEAKSVVLIAVQPMNRHWHASGWAGQGEDGTKMDDIFKNFTHNDDVTFFDTLIDQLVSSGTVDPKRIYILGVSNGLMFASFYGIIRSGSTDGGGLVRTAEHQKLYTGQTPGGNKIAAVAGFSGADPFKGVGWPKECYTRPLPKSTLPIYIVSRICDVVPCHWVKNWMHTLVTEIGSKESVWVLLDSKNRVRSPSLCSKAVVSKHCPVIAKVMGHGMWPEAFSVKMLDFLMEHKLQ